MKKELFIVIIVLVVIGMSLFFIFKNKSSKEIEITIESTAGIPYKWVYEIEDESIVKFDRKYVIKNENTGGKVGGHIYTNYVFKGIKPGKTKVHFKYISLENENNIYKEETDILKVDNNLNISLVLME